MTKELSEYEIQKQIKKQKLVRNEFLYNFNSVGKYNMPLIKRQDVDVKKIKFLSYVDAKKNDIENADKTIHFFTYDWKFEKVYDEIEAELEKLSQYYCLLSPDFSIFVNMPLPLQIMNVFKNRWCGAYFQSKGLKVIPTVSWGDENSFDFCFDGIEKGSVVAVCTYYRENCERDFMLGYNEMLKRIEPSLVLCYDEPFKGMGGNIISYTPTTYEWVEDLDWKEQIQFKWEKRNKNVSGLNSKDFKYFKYDDPYVKDQIVKCSICGHSAIQDQYGNGECGNCGWKFSDGEEEFEKMLGISYPMLVSPTTARKEYEKSLPFKATFDEFVKGLFFYSEMLFIHDNITYEVFLKSENGIVFCSENMQQEYETKQDFINKANINGVLLSELWDDVSFAGFMYCG